jgi:hypothetical protein
MSTACDGRNQMAALSSGTSCQSGRFASELSERARTCLAGRQIMIEQHRMKRPRTKSPSLDEARLRQQAIGVKLRQMFDEVVNEPVPDEFLQILRKADDRSGGH